MGKLDELAAKRKEEADRAREAEVNSFANKVASEVLSKVKDINETERGIIEASISALAKSVAEAVSLSDSKSEKLTGTFKDLVSSLKASLPKEFNNKPNEDLFKKIGNQLASLDNTLDNLELNPIINLSAITKDELKIEVDRILNKLPENNKREVTLAYEKAPATKYINVRLTDGIKFYSAFGGGGGSSGSATESKQDNIISELQAIKSTPVSEANTDGSVTIGDETTTILAENENRKSATIVNDSDETIYLSLSDTAVLNSGIRVNAEGGSAEIEDYTGEISGISASGSKVVTVVEL